MKQKLFDIALDYFKQQYPNPTTELHYENTFQFLIAVILSAQCTDKRVNMVSPKLFKRFPEPKDLAAASPEDVFPYIQSISYPNNKTKHLIGMAKGLVENFNAEVPSQVNLLMTLPGVGRKTAHVIASVIFGQPTLAVDTHVFRVSARIGLTKNAKTPLETETQLMKYVKEQDVFSFHHSLILHGRTICTARKPKCLSCGLNAVCVYSKSKK